MSLLLLMVLVVALGDLVGYAAHWVLHRKWSGRLYRSHMAHHISLYPPWDLTSGEYRQAGRDSGALFFVPVVSAVMLSLFAAVAAAGVPWWQVALLIVEAAAIGWAHDYVHEAMHVEGHRLERHAWFAEARRLHFIHHRSMRRNLGILMFLWDRVFRTFRPK